MGTRTPKWMLLLLAAVATMGVVGPSVIVSNHAVSQVQDGDIFGGYMSIKNRLDLGVFRNVICDLALGSLIREQLEDSTGSSVCRRILFHQVEVLPTGERTYFAGIELQESDMSSTQHLQIDYVYDGLGEPESPPDACSIERVVGPPPTAPATAAAFSTALEYGFLCHVLRIGQDQLLQECLRSPITSLRARTFAFTGFGTYCFIEFSQHNGQTFIAFAESYSDGTFGALRIHRKSRRSGGP